MMKIVDFRPLLDNNSPEESHVPIVLNGNELQELVSPVSCEEFVNSYFSRMSLNVDGPPEEFAPRNLFEQFIPLLKSFAFANENWRGGPARYNRKNSGKYAAGSFRVYA